MRRYRLSVFASGRDTWIGKPASSVFRSISATPESGALTTIYPIESGFELVGWSHTPRAILHPSQLVFLNESAKIVGFGSKIPESLPPTFGSVDTPNALAWVGFVNAAIPSKFITAYRMDRSEGRIVPIGKTVPLEAPGAVKSVAPDAGRRALTQVAWQPDGAWRQSSAASPRSNGEKPPEGYFESWAGSDRNTGLLTSSVVEVHDGCLTIPVAHGPSRTNLSVEIEDARTNSTIASTPMFSADESWRYWQFQIPATSPRVRVVADDHGVDWGEWLAVGTPRTCRSAR